MAILGREDTFGGGGVETPPSQQQPTQQTLPPGGGVFKPGYENSAGSKVAAALAAVGLGGGVNGGIITSGAKSITTKGGAWPTGIRTGRVIAQPLMRGDNLSPTGGPRHYETKAPEDLMKDFYADPSFQKKWVQRLREAGWLPENADAFDAANVFGAFLQEAGAHAASDDTLTLDGIYDRMKGMMDSDGDGVPDGSAGAGQEKAREVQVGDKQTQKDTRRQVDLTNPDEAKRLINETLAQALGREANPEQFTEFLRILNEAEKANPVTTVSTGTTTVTSVDEDGYDTATETSSTQSGGIDQQQRALEYARALPEYKSYQASTTFMDAFLSAISSPVSGTGI